MTVASGFIFHVSHTKTCQIIILQLIKVPRHDNNIVLTGIVDLLKGSLNVVDLIVIGVGSSCKGRPM